jgi:hypothetical protein
VAARSSDYLFITNATDARGLWVNPAGLGMLPEASLMAEMTLERMGSQFRVEQYVIGFNTRGISVGYHRTRFEDDEAAVGQFRVGASLPIRRGALGVTVSRYQQDSTSSRAFGAGLLFMPSPTFQLALTTRNIGRPLVRGVNMPINILGGAQFTSGRFQLAAEAHAAERPGDESGFDFTYRAGGQAYMPLSFPIVIVAALNLGTNFRIDQLHLGVSIGGTRQVTLITSAVPRDDVPVFERFSAAVVARNLLVGQQ